MHVKSFLPIVVIAAFAAQADAASIKLGSSAPPIKVAGWAKGTPVLAFAPSKVYVVEFWATWCGPCKESIPHLTKLAHKYKGKVTFTGVSVWEQQRDDHDTSYVPTVKRFVKQEGTSMDYNVAYDTPDKAMAKTWMQAAGEDGIPTAFVVKNKKIVWIGHPMAGLDETLGEVLAGTYDMAAAQRKIQAAKDAQSAQQKVYEDFGAAMTAKQYQKAFQIAQDCKAKFPEQEEAMDSASVQALFMLDLAKADAYIKEHGPKFSTVYLTAAQSLLMGPPGGPHDPVKAAEYAQLAVPNQGVYGRLLLAAAYKMQAKDDLAKATLQEAKDAAKKQGAPDSAIQELDRDYQQIVKGAGK